MSELLNQVGQTIKQLREVKNLSIDECAKSSGLTRTYWRQVESGERNITIKTLDSLAKTLSVHPSALIMENEKSPSSNHDEEDLIKKLCSSRSQRDLKCVIALLNAMAD